MLYTGYKRVVYRCSMDRCRWEEFLRLISFIFVRLIIQFRLYVVDRFQIITYVRYIYIYMYFYIPAYLFCTLHTRSHLIRDSTVLIRFYIPHRFTFVLFYTRYIFTSSRILYLVSSVERSHTVLYSYFDILHPLFARY